MFAKCRIFLRRIGWQQWFWDGKTTAFKGQMPRETDSINSGMYEEKPHVVTVTPRVRTYREKAKRIGIIDRSEERKPCVRLRTEAGKGTEVIKKLTLKTAGWSL